MHAGGRIGVPVSGARAVRLGTVVVLAALLGAGVSGCAARKKKKGFEELAALSAPAMYQRGMELLARRELRRAKATLEQVQYVNESDRRQEIEPLVRLALADVTFYQGGSLAFIDARSLYLDFVTLYGSHPLAPYVQIQAGMCSLNQVNHPSKDQSLTRQAVSDLEGVLSRFPNSRFAPAARGLLAQARSNLAEHEFLVGRFYLKKKAYPAAAERFRAVLDDYPDYGEREKVYYHLAQAHRLNENDTEARKVLDKLLSDYPNGTYVESARKALAEVAPSPRSEVPRSP